MNLDTQRSSKAFFDSTVNQLIPAYGRNEARQLARMLFAEVLHLSFESVMIDEQIELDFQRYISFQEKVECLKKYHPIQYVLGEAYFYGRNFIVNPDVLIPRQETEELINEILIDNKKAGYSILDIGSGSGCIGITLALELQNVRLTALDIDSKALEVTATNAKRFAVEMECILGNILSMDRFPDRYDIIVSNPPYVTEKEKEQMHVNVLNHEPHEALFVPNDDPLLFYKKIIPLAKDHLAKGGRLYLEINEHFGAGVVRICEHMNPSYLKLVQDINGKDRIVKAMFD